MEILTLRQLDVVRKPCVFLNQDGFYDDLLRLFDRMLREKFFKPSNMELFRVALTVPEIFRRIEEAGAAEGGVEMVRDPMKDRATIIALLRAHAGRALDAGEGRHDGGGPSSSWRPMRTACCVRA